MKRIAALSLAMCLVLAGCNAGDGSEGPVLWYAGDVSVWGESSEAVGSMTYQGDLTVEAMVDALLHPTELREGLRCPFPAEAELLGWSLEGGTLHLDLSPDYDELEDFALTLANYCLTLTLSQLPGVERVSVTVAGHPLSDGHWTEMDTSQALLSGAEERPVEVSADLYFPRAAGRGLGMETRAFFLTEGDVLAEAVTQALLTGPEDEELSSAIPAGTELLSLHLEDGVCIVNLSRSLLDGLPADEGSQILLIYSIVNTLGNLTSVRAVCLQVDGVPLTSLGSVSLPAELEPDFGLAN